MKTIICFTTGGSRIHALKDQSSMVTSSFKVVVFAIKESQRLYAECFRDWLILHEAEQTEVWFLGEKSHNYLQTAVSTISQKKIPMCNFALSGSPLERQLNSVGVKKDCSRGGSLGEDDSFHAWVSEDG